MSKSRLPPPPSRGRPLPPKPPSEGNDEDAPPPLPSRPTGGGGGGKPPPPSFRQPPPPAVNGQGPVDDYLEPDSWSSGDGRPPSIPPKNFVKSAGAEYEPEVYVPSPENSDEESYTEPDLPPPVSRHPPPKSKPPEPEPEPGQETYDDLDEPESPESTDSEEECEPGQETYDQCDIKEADEGMTYEMEPDCVYEAEPPVEEHSPPPSPIEESTYEFVPEDSMHTPPPPSRPAVPAPPDSVPSLPARPPPSRPMDSSSSGDSAPELPPGRPPPTPTNKVVRKVPGDGPQMPGISLGDISEKRANLRKFSAAMSAEVPEEPKPVVIPGDASSVKDRINMFKQVEKGVKPALTPKPSLPVKPTVINKPVETRPPPQPAMTSPTSPPFKPPPQQNNFEECDDIYDEGMSFVPDPLMREEWYHGEIERNDSNEKLYSVGQDGTFLVRKSSKGGDTQPYTLVVLYQGHVYNLKMRVRPDGMVALGEEKPDELAFKDVPSLIQHHRSHDVILVNVKQNKQHKTLLKKHPIAMN